MSEGFEEKVYQGLLFDFYGELLNTHRKEIMEDYLFSDLSVSEIAEEKGTSRQAVFDLVRRSVGVLEEYESKLGLLEKFLSAKKDITEIQKLAGCPAKDITEAELQKIRELSDRILEGF